MDRDSAPNSKSLQIGLSTGEVINILTQAAGFAFAAAGLYAQQQASIQSIETECAGVGLHSKQRACIRSSKPAFIAAQVRTMCEKHELNID